MLERGIFDAISWWPWSLPFLLFEVILFTLFRFNKALEQQGILNDQIYKGPVSLAFGMAFFIPANLFSLGMNIYFLYVSGWAFLLSFPLVGLAMIPANLLGLIPYAQYVLPLVCCILALMQCVLLGFFSLEWISEMNQWFFSFII